MPRGAFKRGSWQRMLWLLISVIHYYTISYTHRTPMNVLPRGSKKHISQRKICAWRCVIAMREFSHWLPLQLSWMKNFVLRKHFNQNKTEVISAPPFSGQVAYSSHCKWLRRYGIDISTGPTAYISVCHFSIVKTDGVSATFPIRFVPQRGLFRPSWQRLNLLYDW